MPVSQSNPQWVWPSAAWGCGLRRVVRLGMCEGEMRPSCSPYLCAGETQVADGSGFYLTLRPFPLHSATESSATHHLMMSLGGVTWPHPPAPWQPLVNTDTEPATHSLSSLTPSLTPSLTHTHSLTHSRWIVSPSPSPLHNISPSNYSATPPWYHVSGRGHQLAGNTADYL